MSWLLRVKRPARTGGCQEERPCRELRNSLAIETSTSGQFIPSQLDFTVRAVRNRRGFFPLYPRAV